MIEIPEGMSEEFLKKYGAISEGVPDEILEGIPVKIHQGIP